MSKKSRRHGRRDRKARPSTVAGNSPAATLAILNVGTGDTKISFDKDNPKERERACRIVTDMLRRGYAILVAAGEKDGKPLYYRATDFDPETAEYIVAGMPEEAPEAAAAPEAGAPAPKKRGRPSGQRLPAESTRAVSVARSAGGMSDRPDSVEARNAMLLKLRGLDPYAGIRHGLASLAAERHEWAGLPMPLDHCSLVVEPTYPRAQALMAFGRAATEEGIRDAEEAAHDKQRKIRGRFYSIHRRSDVIIWEEPDGRIEWGIHPAIHSFDVQFQTLGAQEAWGIEQEGAALQTLATLVPHRQFKQYLLTGSFLETSERSGLTYMFRKLRPTIAIDARDKSKPATIRCALCLHPIAYYRGSWAGAMCPTDDVIAHLMLMRGDEPMFWKRANHHPSWRPEAGL